MQQHFRPNVAQALCRRPDSSGRLVFGLLLTLTLLYSQPRPRPYTTWADYAGTADSMQYSALRQIDKTNVAQW